MAASTVGERGRAGLRERKKQATREALSSAAIWLSLARGVENVTIEDITLAAGVSLRTFRNYFASKYEAISAAGADRARRIGASLVERPADEPLWTALITATLEHYKGAEQALGTDVMNALRMLMFSPGMRAEYLKINSEMQNALAAAIAQRIGTDVEADMYPQVLAGAVIAASQVAVRRWYAADPPVPLRPLLERAFQHLATACSQPAP